MGLRNRRSRTPNQPNGATASTRRPCSACYCESDQQPVARCPLSDLLPVRGRTSRTNTFPQDRQCEPVSEPAAATRKRRRKETDENAGSRTPEAHCAEWPDSPLPESGDDEALEPPLDGSPTRADSKCRRRLASSLRPSINAEKMLTASPGPKADELLKRGSYPSLLASFNVADSFLVGCVSRNPPTSLEHAATILKSLGESNSGNTDDFLPDDCDVTAATGGKTAELLPTFASQTGAQFRIINELDIDQIENN